MSAFAHNPFSKRKPRKRDHILSDPAITVDMLTEFVRMCGAYELRLFVLLILTGMRMSELLFLFGDQIGGRWLEIRRHPDLNYSPKSSVGREVPLLEVTRRILVSRSSGSQKGLLFLRKHATLAGLPVWSRSKVDFVQEFELRCRREGAIRVADRLRLRDAMLRETRALSCKSVSSTFKRLHRKLGWPAAATPHQFRHTFATALEDSGVPESYRKMLLGHAPDRSVTADYTHLSRKQMREFYERVARNEFGPVVDAIQRRAVGLGLIDSAEPQGGEKILTMPPRNQHSVSASRSME